MASPLDLEPSLKQVSEAWAKYKDSQSSSQPDPLAARRQVVEAAKALVEEAQGPADRLFEFTFNPMQNAAMTIALQSGMIDALPEEGSISAIDLARKIGADSGLVVRIMRLLCAIRFIRELEHRNYSHTTISKMLLGSPNPVKATLEIFSDAIYPTVSYLHEDLKERGYKEPADPLDAPMQRFYQDKSVFYDILAKFPGRTETFALAMTANSAATFDLAKYPFPEKLASTDKEEVALVDCGGGRGQVLKELGGIFPSWHGKMLLQDRADVIDLVKDEKDRGFEIMVHNFWEPQPVKAHAYLFRFIFMDQDDNRARSILRALKPSFVKEHTKLLIIENIISERGANLLECGFDFIMMCTAAAKMRTVSQIETLLQSEGFEMSGVYRSGPAGERCLIEAQLK